MISSKKELTFKGHLEIDQICRNDLLSKWSILNDSFFEVNFFSQQPIFEVSHFRSDLFHQFLSDMFDLEMTFFEMDHFPGDRFQSDFFVNNFRCDRFQNDSFCDVTFLSFAITCEISTVCKFSINLYFLSQILNAGWEFLVRWIQPGLPLEHIKFKKT